jgi:oxygen-independent coproporphyrinogen III oxidase
LLQGFFVLKFISLQITFNYFKLFAIFKKYLLRKNNLKETALYIHIPFCDHKCIYCDFYSIITEDNILPYLNALKKEISYYAKFYSEGRIYTSIFFGGGTPSLMKPEYISEIIKTLKENYNISANTEITLETNPGTVDKEKLKLFRDIGINRISIGIQSFDENELKFLTRIHDKDTATKTVIEANEIGFKNINIDLIFNLPGQTKEKWESNLNIAVKLPVTHISAYSLILERGTILNKMVLDGKVKIQDEDHDADLYETCINFLERYHFHQYEVSNFAKQGFECIHNNAYWRYKDYLSFGTSSHSFMDEKRWWNYSSLKKYLNEIENKNNAVANYEILNKEQMLNEYIMLALRSCGLDIAEFKNKFGDHWLHKNSTYLNELMKRHFISIDKDYIRLTKGGYAVCDEILNKIL